MLDEAVGERVEAMAWMAAARAAHVDGRAGEADWRAADRALRRLAGRRAALDEEEARWLLIARRAQVHRYRGYATFLEYLERVLGHAPHAARERLRVAEALASLPSTRAAMAAGEVAYTAVRELTRVATAATEDAWLTALADKTVREIETAVAGRRPGDTPDAPPDPAHREHALRLRLSPSTYALFVAARRSLEGATDQTLSDDDVIASLCRRQLASASHVGRETSNRPPYQIAVTTCDDCRRTWQDAAGQTVEISAADLERARCDADDLGRVDRGTPTRVTRTIPWRIRRAVVRRDRGRCIAPGCRDSRFVDVHHIVPRASGGDHDPSRLACLCTRHHTDVHENRLRIEGVAPHALRFLHADGRLYGTGRRADRILTGQPPVRRRRSTTAAHGALPIPSAPARCPAPTAPTAPTATTPAPATVGPERLADARRALTRLGFSVAIARDAVDRASSHVGPAASLPALIVAALRVCPRPRTEIMGCAPAP